MNIFFYLVIIKFSAPITLKSNPKCLGLLFKKHQSQNSDNLQNCPNLTEMKKIWNNQKLSR